MELMKRDAHSVDRMPQMINALVTMEVMPDEAAEISEVALQMMEQLVKLAHAPLNRPQSSMVVCQLVDVSRGGVHLVGLAVHRVIVGHMLKVVVELPAQLGSVVLDPTRECIDPVYVDQNKPARWTLLSLGRRKGQNRQSNQTRYRQFHSSIFHRIAP